MSSDTMVPTPELELLTAENKPDGIICLVGKKLYHQPYAKIRAGRRQIQPAKFFKDYVEGDYFDTEGVPGYAAFGKRPGPQYHQRSKYFNSYRKTLHRGRKFEKPNPAKK